MLLSFEEESLSLSFMFKKFYFFPVLITDSGGVQHGPRANEPCSF